MKYGVEPNVINVFLKIIYAKILFFCVFVNRIINRVKISYYL